MALRKKKTAPPATSQEIREKIEAELGAICKACLSKESVLKVPKGKYKKLGPLPIQQKTLVEYLWTDCNFGKVITSDALRARVQRVANELFQKDKKVKKIFRFNPHKRDAKVKGHNPSRKSQANEIKDLQKRVAELEDFKRQFDQLLRTGRPEPSE